jgi:nucleotide-binding universal stress UspA family protein
MGSHGTGAVGSLITGSVTTKVVHLGTRPVLVIPSTRPLTGSAYGPPQRAARVLVPVDGSAGATAALRAVLGLVPWFRDAPEFHLLAAHEGTPLGVEIAGMVSGDALREHQRKWFEAALRPARETLAGRGMQAVEHTAVGPPVEHIRATVAAQRCDVVCLGARGTGVVGSLIPGSTATKVLRAVDVPVLVVPRPRTDAKSGGGGPDLRPGAGAVSARRRGPLLPPVQPRRRDVAQLPDDARLAQQRAREIADLPAPLVGQCHEPATRGQHRRDGFEDQRARGAVDRGERDPGDHHVRRRQAVARQRVPQLVRAAAVDDQARVVDLPQQRAEMRVELDDQELSPGRQRVQDRPGRAAGAAAQLDDHPGRPGVRQSDDAAHQKARARGDGSDLARAPEELAQKDEPVIDRAAAQALRRFHSIPPRARLPTPLQMSAPPWIGPPPR